MEAVSGACVSTPSGTSAAKPEVARSETASLVFYIDELASAPLYAKLNFEANTRELESESENTSLVFCIDELASAPLYAKLKFEANTRELDSPVAALKTSLFYSPPLASLAAALTGLTALTVGFSMLSRAR